MYQCDEVKQLIYTTQSYFHESRTRGKSILDLNIVCTEILKKKLLHISSTILLPFVFDEVQRIKVEKRL